MILSLKNSLKMCTNVNNRANNIESLLICRHDATNFRKAVKGIVTRGNLKRRLLGEKVLV